MLFANLREHLRSMIASLLTALLIFQVGAFMLCPRRLQSIDLFVHVVHIRHERIVSVLQGHEDLDDVLYSLDPCGLLDCRKGLVIDLYVLLVLLHVPPLNAVQERSLENSLRHVKLREPILLLWSQKILLRLDWYAHVVTTPQRNLNLLPAPFMLDKLITQCLHLRLELRPLALLLRFHDVKPLRCISQDILTVPSLFGCGHELTSPLLHITFQLLEQACELEKIASA
mmetsp:Transcript_52095/g.124055  ORF Transcript_52095/g.124055 Transcript_52095/m.124055 type:complete len:228 (+) Transcript_52095:1283-1966(+)